MSEENEGSEKALSTVTAGRRPSIVVAGIGGAGCNFVHRMSLMGIRGPTTIAVNTDRLHLELVDADRKLLIGKDRVHGTGAGADPRIGRLCMEEAGDELAALIGSPDVVFVVAGLGGGTGTGGAPEAARIAHEAGAIAVGVAFMPFGAERGRSETAKSGLEQFRQRSDAVMVMENDRLLTMAPDLPIEQAFLKMDRLIVDRIGGMMEMMALPSKLLETQKVLEALPSDGMAMVVCGDGCETADITCEAVDHPLFELECAAAASVTASTVRGIAEVMGAGIPAGGFRMPMTNVLVGTRTGPSGTGKKVVPLVSGMKAYPVNGAPRRPHPDQPAPLKPLRQTRLLDAQWTALRPE